ncbi:hypothetical protein WME94_02745 [Sorangium sp. So ce429]
MLEFTQDTRTRHRLPVPDVGSPRLHSYLSKHNAVRVLLAPASFQKSAASEPDSALSALNGLMLYSNESAPAPHLWLGLLERSSLDPGTASQLDFEGRRGFPTSSSSRSTIELRHWPHWSWRGFDLISVGGWSDWRMIFWGSAAGVWTYAYLPERMSFEAGEILTWLEILAFEQQLDIDGQRREELAFPLRSRRHAGALARRLCLRRMDECSDHRVTSYEGDGLWLRELSPPIGRSFLVLRSDSVARAVDVIKEAKDHIATPPMISVSNWSPNHEILIEALRTHGLRAAASGRLWWSDFRHLR